MIKFFCITLICVLVAVNGRAQVNSGPASADNKSQSTPSNSTSQDVLFATNEDCDLYINGQFKTAVTKNAHKYLKLTPGTYSFAAKSRLAGVALEEKFSVKDGKATEVFIDLLYFLDLQQQAKNGSGNKQLVMAGSTKPNDKPAIAKQGGNTVPPGQLQAHVVQALSANMISISGGSFIMGNNKAVSKDEAEHTVTIGPVLFGKHEVTQEQWGAIMGYNPSDNKGCLSCPVENVSWEEVMRFIRKLNTLSGRRFRLPTEAEWEFVARMGGREEVEQAGGQEELLKRTAWYMDNSNKKTHPVGLQQPNKSGIYDLQGNVAEWCFDWYGADYYKEQNNQMDPDGPPSGKDKVYRGGSFKDPAGYQFQPTARNKEKPASKSRALGFRLVMDIE